MTSQDIPTDPPALRAQIADQVKAGAVSVRDTIADSDVPAAVRRPVPVAVALAVVVGAALVVYGWRRRS